MAMIDRGNIGACLYLYAVEQRGSSSKLHGFTRTQPNPPVYEISKWDHPFSQPTEQELEALEATILQRRQDKANRKARIAADKGQGVSIPDLVARIDDLVEELGLDK